MTLPSSRRARVGADSAPSVDSRYSTTSYRVPVQVYLNTAEAVLDGMVNALPSGEVGVYFSHDQWNRFLGGLDFIQYTSGYDCDIACV